MTKEVLLDRLGCEAAMGGGSLKSQIATLETAASHPASASRRCQTGTDLRDEPERRRFGQER